jgi:hypothetical protein
VTAADPLPTDLRSAARWCAEVAVTLTAGAVRLGRLAEGVAEDWLDEHGREWAERAALLHRELGRGATDAAELGEALARHADATDCTDHTDGPMPTVAVPGRGARSPRARLGDTSGAHVDGERGMALVQLPPQDPG